MKRIVALLLAVMMCVSLFAGCGNQAAENPTEAPKVENNEAQAGNAQTEAAPVEFSYPTTGSLSFWTWPNPNYTANYPSFEATPAAGYGEEATGIKVDYIDDHSNTDEAFQLMIASEKMPDLVAHNWLSLYPGGATAAYEDGVCIRLNDVIDQYMPNFKAFLESRPDVKKMISDDEGNIYFVPQVGADSSLYTFGSYVRADMLEELGEEIPTTLDGWHDLFVKVKDTYGITPYSLHNGWLLNMSFISYAYGVGDTDYIVDDNGKAVYNRTSDHYKEFLMTLNQWYNEGLIDTDIATISVNDVMAKVINGEVFASSAWLGSGMQAVETASEDFEVQAFATPALKEGEKAEFTYGNWAVYGQGVVITPDCENVETAARWLDYFFSEEGILLYNYGKEGKDFTMVDGAPVFSDDVLYNIPEGWTQSQSIGAINFATNGYTAGYKDEWYYPQHMVTQSAKDALAIWADVEGGGFKHKWPNVSYTADEASEMARYSTNLSTTANEWGMNFVIGAVSFDQWDAYIAEMEAMGANEALAINQAALDRYNNR